MPDALKCILKAGRRPSPNAPKAYKMNSPDAIKKPKPPAYGSPEWLPHAVRALEPHVKTIKVVIYVFSAIGFATAIAIAVFLWRSL